MNTSVEFNTAESWVTARKYAGLLGEVPNSFSSTIRALLLDQERGKGLTNGTRFLILRLLRSAGVRSPVYFATLTYQEEMIDGVPYIAPEDFLELYSPAEIGAVVGLIYLYRKAKRIVSPEEWPHIAGPLQTCVEMGGHVGYIIPPIGPVVGMLSSGLRYIAVAAFLSHDKQGFVEYRRHLKQKNLRFDEGQEMARWGCTSTQIGAVFLQSLGFGIPLAEAFTRGLSPDTRASATLDREAYRFAINEMWLDSLLKDATVPDIAHRVEFYPTKTAGSKAIEKATRVRSSGSAHSWLNKVKEDIQPDTTPQLFEKGAGIRAVEPAAAEGDALGAEGEIEELAQE